MYYPRSFLKFILLGFLLVSLPLLYALGELILSLDQLQTQGREAVQQAAQAGRASRQLFEQAGTLERIVRQHLILDDSALLDDYDRVRQEFRTTATQLALLPLGAEPLAALDALTDSESRLHKLLTMPQRSADTQTQLADGYARLADRTQTMLAASNQLTESAIERLQDIATQGRQKWLYLALATAAIALALAILFAVLIARPIRQVDQAIRRMGTADFTHRDRSERTAGPALPRAAARMAAFALVRSRGAAEPVPAARFARAQDAAHRGARRRGAPARQRRRQAVAGTARDRAHRPPEHAVAAEADRGSPHLPPDARDGAAGGGTRFDAGRGAARAERAQAGGVCADGDLRPALGPAQVVGDSDKVRTIVDNLVSNAIKYSPRSASIMVALGTEQGFAVLDVVDRGPGIDPVERERIFDSFYQGRPPVEGRVKGSGLGLAIAREYALAHGGRIEVLDRADREHGAHFRLRLPLAAGDAGAETRPEADAARIRMAGGG